MIANVRRCFWLIKRRRNLPLKAPLKDWWSGKELIVHEVASINKQDIVPSRKFNFLDLVFLLHQGVILFIGRLINDIILYNSFA
ncbi:hypothetical protein HDC91_001091 [Mucilaginibacter sp. AK015]|nr:hypothetical protein [Mucilaginibacter sp. AK015]